MFNRLFKKYVNRETVTYLVFGVLTTLVNYLIFVILNVAGVHLVINQFIAWIVALIFAFFTNKKFVFNSKDYSLKNLVNEFIPFTAARVLSFLFETVFILFTVKFMHMNTYLSKIIASVGVVIMNYVASKFFIFKEKPEGKKSLLSRLSLIDNDSDGHNKLISGNITYLLAFIIPVIILVIIYYGRSIYPFGEECYLRSDMYHQYAPFYSELWNKLTNGGSLTYSWNIGMGTNFTALSAYYLASPINWVIALFPQKYMIEIMNSLIILKMAGSSVTFTYYVNKHFNTKTILSACFGIFYGLSGYLAAYSWNIMWLDCILLLPLIVLGLEKLVKEDKYMLYTVSLGLCILSNYYIAIMVCFACVFLFIHNIISMPKPKYAYIYFKKAFYFALFSLIAGGLAAILLIPEIYAFKLSASNEFSFPEVLNCYFPVLEMLVRHLPNVDVHLGLEHYPNIYCGTFIFMLLPLYWFNPNSKLREKITKTLFVIILLTSYNMNIPNFIWHGFHFPNSLPARQGFIYIFLVLSMCFEAAINIKEYTKNQILGAFAAAIGFLVIAEQCYSGDVYNFKIFYTAGFFLVLYLSIMLIYKYSKLSKYVAMVLIIVVSAFECGMNMEFTGLSTTGRTYYLSNYDDMEALRDLIAEEDTDFYRSEIYYGYRSKNDTAWHNIKGISTFSSTAHAGITAFLDKLGCETSFNAYSSHGLTVVSQAMLNVKYTYSSFAREEGTDLSFIASSGNTYLYRNNYTLPVAFLVDSDINSSWDFERENPFDIQNQFIYNNTGINRIFYSICVSNEGDYTEILPDEKCHAYIYLPVSRNDLSIDVVINGMSSNYSDLGNMDIIDIGYISPDDYVYVTNAPYGMEVYTYRESDFITAFETLNEGSLQVSSYSDTKIEGTVNASYSGTMMCSIPYEKGWSVYVDGKKVSTFAIKDALLGFNVSAGEHDIVLKYSPSGLVTGTVITLFSLALLILIFVFDKKREKKKDDDMSERCEIL